MSTIGTIELIAKIDTSQYKQGAREIEKTNQDVKKSTEDATDTSGRSWVKMGAVMGAVAGAMQVAITKAFSAIGNSIGSAVKRVDTLNNSSRTFENMGFTAQDVSKAMKALDKSIRGLPTPLDQAVRGMQMITASTNDIGKSQKIFAAMNNAIIGFGGSADDVSNAVLQMSQAFAGGRIDAMTWNSMLNSNLGPALNAIARQMGITTKALKAGLSDGSISVDKFQKALIDMNEKGGGGMKSFEKIAKDATSGIGTGWTNMQTAITRGTAAIIKAIGSAGISSAITNFGKNAEKALQGAASAITALVKSAQTDGSTLNTALGATKESIAGIGGQMDALNQSLTEDTTTVTAFGTAWKAVTSFIGATLLGLVVVIGYATQGLIQVFTSVVNNVKKMIDIIATVMAFIMIKFTDLRNFFGMFFTQVAVGAVNLANKIRSIFTNIGTNIGNAVGNAFKGAVNGILGWLQSRVNNIIDVVNGAIGAIDKITPGSLPRIGRVSIPKLAEGGIVSSPTLAMVGEGREPEAVIPLSKLDKMMSNNYNSSNSQITINLSGVMASSQSDLRTVAKQLVGAIDQERAAKQQTLIMGNT